MSKTKNKKKKKHTSLKILVTLLVLCVLAVAGLAGYNAWQNMKNKQEAEQEQTEREALYQKEAAAMQGVYKQWAEAVDQDTIYEGVTAMGIDLSGMTEEEAKEALDTFYDETVLSRKIVLTYKGKTWEYTYADLGYSADTGDIASAAYAVCREGSVRERYNGITALKAEPVDLLLSDDYDASTIDDILAAIAEEIYVEPKDAEIDYSDGNFNITKEVVGYKLNKKKTKQSLQEKLQEGGDIELELSVKKVKPEKTEKQLKEISDVLGAFSTYYDLYNEGRNTNLEVGSGRVSGTMLMPGEEFNFNETVSPVDYASGYMDASTIVNGEYVPGIGGGLCQVSTTLYNAVIRAELEVTERWEHAYDPGYVPNGLDAAIYVGGINFRFVNSTEYPIFIVMGAGGGELWAKVYGHETRDPSRTISFENEKTGTIPKPKPVYTDDDSMYEGEEEVTSRGHEGSTYDVYKIITENGVTTSEYFSHSEYNASPDKITRGTKKKKEESSKKKKKEESSQEESESESESEPEPEPESEPESEPEPEPDETEVPDEPEE